MPSVFYNKEMYFFSCWLQDETIRKKTKMKTAQNILILLFNQK